MIATRAPFRIPLGGGGTDLPSFYQRHGGFFVSAAIDKYVYIAANRPHADDLIRLKYSRYEQVADPADLRHDLVRHALILLGITDRIEIDSLADFPSGTGMGSSGSYLVALLKALHALKSRIPNAEALDALMGKTLSVGELAEEAFSIEADFAGLPVGKQDPYMAAFGGITCIEIERDGSVVVYPLPISEESRQLLAERLLLFYTGIRRPSRDILEQQRRESSLGDPTVIESLKATKDIGYRVRDALAKGDLDQFGRLMHEHWMNKQVRSDKISNSRIGRWYFQARAAGALGGKIMGAGGGGFFIFYCPSEDSIWSVREAMSGNGLREIRWGFDDLGAAILTGGVPYA